MRNGSTVYVTQREVSAAPTDKEVQRYMFHTAVLEVDGRVAKFEVSYDSVYGWRFRDLATSIMGTVNVRLHAGA